MSICSPFSSHASLSLHLGNSLQILPYPTHPPKVFLRNRVGIDHGRQRAHVGEILNFKFEILNGRKARKAGTVLRNGLLNDWSLNLLQY
jgi:hypothetical protein